MIGIAVVSHSSALAHAAVELALQMGGDSPPPIEVAAGTTDGGLGTDAAEIAATIERLLDAGVAGVLVVMDLGSAILSAEMALEFLSDRSRVVLSPAPFVEGLVSAVVLAATGADLETVAAEASRALAAKRDQLDGPESDSPGAPPPAPAGTPSAPGPPAPEASFEAVVRNPSGLHARPAALFVRAASRHDAEVDIADAESGTPAVSGRSLIALMALGVRPGTRIRVTARGREAEAAIAELRALVEDGFGEL